MTLQCTDRYDGNHPDPATVCNGPCEGMGVYPEPKTRNPDGTIPVDTVWTFKTCSECHGTGRKP